VWRVSRRIGMGVRLSDGRRSFGFSGLRGRSFVNRSCPSQILNLDFVDEMLGCLQVG
jgi:hypothetical protein